MGSTTHEYNGGLDVGLFKSRIRFSVDAYYKKTYNLLYNYRLPQTTGYSQVSANVGNIDNKGVEFEIHTRKHRAPAISAGTPTSTSAGTKARSPTWEATTTSCSTTWATA